MCGGLPSVRTHSRSLRVSRLGRGSTGRSYGVDLNRPVGLLLRVDVEVNGEELVVEGYGLEVSTHAFPAPPPHFRTLELGARGVAL